MTENTNIFSTPMMSGLAVTSPGLYFFMKHWSVILSLFLILLMTIGGTGAWLYTNHIQNKLTVVTNELEEYKNSYDMLNQNYLFLRDEVLTVGKKIDSFNADIDVIKRDSSEFRRKLNIVTNQNPSNINEVQQNFDNIWKELNDRWNGL